MTTITIKRKKQPIGFFTSLKVSTREGQTISLKQGESATISTDYPEELWVKRFIQNSKISTGITGNTERQGVSLELFYHLPLPALYMLLMVSAMLVYVAVAGFSSKRYISISLFLILVALIAKTRQGALQFKKC